MFKNVTPINKSYDSVNIVVMKDKQKVASFHGNNIIGQINSDIIKSCTTSYDPLTIEKTIVLEV